ncbi:tRNA-thr(GGU) m(6)t(6)A37 methyltransferase [Wolffia australiana]
MAWQDDMTIDVRTVTMAASMAAIAALALATIKGPLQWRRRWRALAEQVQELEEQLKKSLEKADSERRGRIRAQQDLRRAIVKDQITSSSCCSSSSYPMRPIATVKSCFTTRNGTPRQPLLVKLARARLRFDASLVPASALEGLSEYSHCWVLYVFHLNTDLDKLWKDPCRSGFKAKVRVPRLKGGKMGVLATRSPHRPCPIGLTVAKVEKVDGNDVLLSGIDLVDGTPVLDIKPYLPYADCVPGAVIPNCLQDSKSLEVSSVSFSKEFSSSLTSCWASAGKGSLYASEDEFKELIKQVLSWDIRSISQRKRPHNGTLHNTLSFDPPPSIDNESDELSSSPHEVTYHLIIEGMDVTYYINEESRIMVEGVFQV